MLYGGYLMGKRSMEKGPGISCSDCGRKMPYLEAMMTVDGRDVPLCHPDFGPSCYELANRSIVYSGQTAGVAVSGLLEFLSG